MSALREQVSMYIMHYYMILSYIFSKSKVKFAHLKKKKKNKKQKQKHIQLQIYEAN